MNMDKHSSKAAMIYKVEHGKHAGQWTANLSQWGGGAISAPIFWTTEAEALDMFKALGIAFDAGRYEQRMMDNAEGWKSPTGIARANADLLKQRDELLAALKGMMEWARRVKQPNPGNEVATATIAIANSTK